jgi:curved DNA-binding protein CbpA
VVEALMAQLARGAITDRPWGQTLGALGTRGLTGELTVTSDGKPYRIAFTGGAVVGASSPLANDAAVRVALTGGLVSSTQVNDITRRVASSPHRDEVEVIAEAAKLSPEHAQRLRRRLVAQRAARTFSLEQGDFVIDDRITVPVIPGAELDVRSVVYLGAKNNMSEAKLADELNLFGAYFRLVQGAVPDLQYFGFTDVEKPALRKLIDGINLEELERQSPELGERTVRAIVYALASVGACEFEVAPHTVPGRVTRESIPPPRSSSSTSAPTLRRGQTNAPTAVGATGTGRTEVPDGMQFRTPRASTVPGSRTTTPVAGTRAPSTPPPLFDVPATRAPTDPTLARTATPTEPVPSRTATPATTPPESRTPTPKDHPAFDRPVSARSPTPSGGYPTVGRAQTPVAVGRAQTPIVSRTQTTPGGPVISRTISGNRARVPSAPPARPPSGQHPIVTPLPPTRSQRGSNPPPSRNKRNTAATIETETLIRDRLALVDKGADHFQLLGIAQDASPDVIRAAYFTLARKLHPDRLTSLGIVDAQRDAQRLFAQINTAFAVLNDTVKRTEYLAIVARGGESAVRAEEAKADELAMRVMHAEEAFRRGEMALRREQLEQALAEFTTAVELQPTEPEYQALHTWTKFAAATDKQAIAHATRTNLMRAAERTMNSPTARFYLGRVERILGREREALEHFHEVLRIKPNHSEASSEVRILEQRLKKR